MSLPAEKVLELKTLGNTCVKKGQYAEAILHYTQAIKLDRSSSQLYSNRSHAFLKLQHYYYALEDAKEAIQLDPLWYKAYFRQAEVEYATRHYAEALESYRKASQIQADPALLDYVIKTNKELLKQRKLDQQIPWVAAGIGLIIGVVLVVLDATLPKSSIFEHPFIQVLVTIALSLAGLGLGKSYKWFIISQRKSLLEPPIDLLEQDEGNSEKKGENCKSEARKPTSRYTKPQARHRYRLGKT